MRMKSIAIKALIDRQRYPIDQLQHPQRALAVARVRAALKEDGCAVIRDFFSPVGLAKLLSEATARKAQAHYSGSKACNVYFGHGDPKLPQDHPQNIFLKRTNGFIPADCYGPDSASHRLYFWPPLKQFMTDCLAKKELYIFEDPVSNMIVNVVRPGQQFPWHYDTNEFTITMLLQAAQAGGHFEYVPKLRNQDDECYPQV